MHQIYFSWADIFGILLLIAISVSYFLFILYGAYLSFKKKWYLGVVALTVPGFALVVGASKVIFKKDLLR